MARCSGCGRQWTAPTQTHCKGCHLHFSSASAADLHLRTHDDGECVEHLARRWSRTARLPSRSSSSTQTGTGRSGAGRRIAPRWQESRDVSPI